MIKGCALKVSIVMASSMAGGYFAIPTAMVLSNANTATAVTDGKGIEGPSYERRVRKREQTQGGEGSDDQKKADVRATIAKWAEVVVCGA